MESSISDIQLINQILQGDKAMFTALYERHKRRIFLICMRYAKTRQEAEDYLQDSFFTVFQSLSKFNIQKGSFNQWSSTVSINCCLQQLRKKKLKFLSSAISDLMVVPNHDDFNIIEHLSLKELTLLVQKLPDGYRTIFNLYVIDGYSHPEIAELMNISVNTSKSQLFKARKQLKAFMKNLGYELSYGQL